MGLILLNASVSAKEERSNPTTGAMWQEGIMAPTRRCLSMVPRWQRQVVHSHQSILRNGRIVMKIPLSEQILKLRQEIGSTEPSTMCLYSTALSPTNKSTPSGEIRL